MSQYDADAAGGEPSPASSSVTPTENVGLASNANEALARECRYRFSSYCVLPKGHDGDHSDTPFGYEVRPIADWPAFGMVPDIEQASVRPASPDPAEAADEMGGHFGPCCYGSNHQAAEAADAAAEAAYQDSQNTDPQYREQRAYERGVVDEARRHPDQHPSAAVAPLEPIPTDWGVGPLTHPAAVAHDPTICTGTDAVPCGCACFDCNERGIHQAAEAKTRVATVPAESESAVASAAVAPLDACPDCGHDVDHTTPCPDGCPMCPSAAVAPLDVEALRTALDGLDVYAYDRDLHGEPLEINEATHRIAAAYDDAIRKRGGA